MSEDWLLDKKQPLGWRVLDWLMGYVIPWFFVVAILGGIGLLIYETVRHL